jgi:hypothetical protein
MGYEMKSGGLKRIPPPIEAAEVFTAYPEPPPVRTSWDDFEKRIVAQGSRKDK